MSANEGGPAVPPLTFSVWIAGIIARWKLVLKVMAATVVLAAITAVVLPPVYEARASFVTASSSNKMASALSGGMGLQGIVSQLGVGSVGEPSESPNFYAKLIESEELRRRLLHSRFRDPRGSLSDSATLLDILRIEHDDPQRRVEIALKKVRKSVGAGFDLKTNLVELKVTSRFPDLAAATANRTIELVDAFNHEQRVSRARSKRIFVQSRLDSARFELNQAEERQRYFYDQNRQWRSSPQLVFDEGRLRRNAEVATDLFLTLQRQFEAARLEEFNDAAVITVVDPAVPPRKARWPRYWLLLATSLMAGGILGVLVAGSATILADWRRRNPERAEAISESLSALPLPGARRRRSRTA